MVIVEETPNDADALANILRNAGQLLHYEFAPDLDALKSALDKTGASLVLAASGLQGAPLDRIAAVLAGEPRDIGLIAVGERADEPDVVAALKAGALDLVSYDLPEHLALVVARETANLQRMAEVHRYQENWAESERRCRALLDSSRDAIAYVHEGMHVYANASYLDLFGFALLDDIEGTPILDMVTEDDHARFKDFLRAYARQPGGVESLEVHCQSPGKGVFKALMEISPASIEGEPCIQIVIRNQSVGKELESKLKYLSKQDMVTGLFNRQYFMEELEMTVRDTVAGSAETSTLLFVLIDNFRKIKETLGLAGADLVISDVANIIRQKTGENGIAARFGDSSFTVLCRGCSVDAGQALAESIRHAVEEHIVEVEGQSIPVTCSIGLSLITENAPNAQEVLSRADLACDVAVSAGGNRIHLHNPVADEKAGADRTRQWNELVQEALREDRFTLVYQPIVSMQGDTGEKYEVLLRMKDAQGEEVLPGQFLAAAREGGLITDIDRWVITHTTDVLAERRREGAGTVFFIKVSGETLSDPELALWINQLLKQHRLPGDALVFEIAEADASTHLKHAKAFITAIHALQCRAALDHFGGSPNSFQLLKHLPVDFLKISGSFVHNLANDAENQAMIKSIVEMARSMNKECIAEFVEDAHSLAVLFQHGVHYIQGYFLQEPSEQMDYDFSSEAI